MSTRLIKKLRLVVLVHIAIKAIKLYKRRGLILNAPYKENALPSYSWERHWSECKTIEWSNYFGNAPKHYLSFHRNSKPQYSFRISNSLLLTGAL
jgi:hypothetical protein